MHSLTFLAIHDLTDDKTMSYAQFFVRLFMMTQSENAQWRLTGQESLFYWHIA